MPAINMPREKRDALERALGIAQGVYGIVSQAQANSRASKEAEQKQGIYDLQKQAAQDEQSGIIRKKDLLDKADKIITVPEGTKGATPWQVREGAEVKTLFIMPKQSNDSALDAFIKRQTLEKNALDIAEKKNPKATPDQKKVATFARRLEQSEADLSNLLDGGFDPAEAGNSVQSFGLFPEMLKSSDYKQYQQLKDNFINATLRRESGASISNKEYDSADRQYFPVAGDTPKVKEQKRQNRLLVMEGLKNEAGPGLEGLQIPAEQVAQAGAKPKSKTVNAGYGGGAPQIKEVKQNGWIYDATTGKPLRKAD